MATELQTQMLWWLLRDVSLALTNGMKLGIAGANGSGKTTLLRAITGDVALSAGETAPSRYLSFQFRNGWHCQFLEEDLKTSSITSSEDVKCHLAFGSPSWASLDARIDFRRKPRLSSEVRENRNIIERRVARERQVNVRVHS